MAMQNYGELQFDDGAPPAPNPQDLAARFGGAASGDGFYFNGGDGKPFLDAYSAAFPGQAAPKIISGQEYAAVNQNPDAPGNNEGGSDWANILKLAGIIGTAGAATGGIPGFGGMFDGATIGNAPGIVAEGSSIAPAAATGAGDGLAFNSGGTGPSYFGGGASAPGGISYPGYGGAGFPDTFGFPAGGGGGSASITDAEDPNAIKPLGERAATTGGAAAADTAVAPANAAPGFLDKILNGVTSNPLSAASLGLTLAGLFRQSDSKGASEQLRQISTPTQQLAQQLIDKAKGGTLSPVAADLLGQAKTGPAAMQAASLRDQSQNGPIASTEKDLLDQYKSGEINAGAKFDIEKWKQQQINASKNYFAKAGMSDSDAARKAIADIESKATAMTDTSRQGLLDAGLKTAGLNNQIVANGMTAQQIAQQLTTQGLSAEQINNQLLSLGLTAQQIAMIPLTTAVQEQAKRDQSFQTAQSSALQSLMLLQAMQSRGTPAPAAA